MGKDRWQTNIIDFSTDFNMEFSDLQKIRAWTNISDKAYLNSFD
jgi:hypothetical protein